MKAKLLVSTGLGCFAAAILVMSSTSAVAQYNVFDSNGMFYTNVIINGVPQSLAQVQDFEKRCHTVAHAGNWWVDGEGNAGLMSGAAQYNMLACLPVGSVRTAGRNGVTMSGGRCLYGPLPDGREVTACR